MSEGSSSSEDPFQGFREAYDQAIASWAQASERFMASPEAADASREFMQRYVEAHSALRLATQAAAESIHFPTTDDIAQIAQLVINVERKVDEVSERIRSIDERLQVVEAAAAQRAEQPPPPDPAERLRAPDQIDPAAAE